MNKKYLLSTILGLFLCGALTPAEGHTDEGCADFSWDVSRELDILRRPAKSVERDTVVVGEHYSVRLAPQAGVQFVVAPEREARSTEPRAAVLRFRATRPGRHRVAITSRHWIDMVVDGAIVKSVDHQGRADCKLLHKVVEFDLPAGRELTLQLSGQDDAVIGLAITGPAAP